MPFTYDPDVPYDETTQRRKYNRAKGYRLQQAAEAALAATLNDLVAQGRIRANVDKNLIDGITAGLTDRGFDIVRGEYVEDGFAVEDSDD